MTAALALALLLGADEEVETLTGKVVVVGRTPVVSLVQSSGRTRLSGELCAELQRLASFEVAVTGRPNGELFELMDYSIVDIGGGAKPIVGMLLKSDEGAFALRDGDGDAIPLSLRPSSKRRLSRMNGAKIWVFGKQSVSGEYQVRRYGVLKKPKRAAVPVGEVGE